MTKFLTPAAYLALPGKVSRTFHTVRYGAAVEVTLSWSFDGETLYVAASDAGTVFAPSGLQAENEAARYLLTLGYEVEQSVRHNLTTLRWLHWEVVTGRQHAGLAQQRAAR